jgi:hypothetical protein
MPPDAASTAALNLRPLPLGELLDRAFTLYFRNIVAFSALLAVVLVPSVIVSYIQTRQLFGAYISLIQHQIAAPNSTPDLSALTAAAPSPALTALQLAFAFIIIPISYAAVVVGVSRAYVGLPVTFADCYRQALRRWLAVLILIFIWFVLALFAFFAFFLVLGISAGVIGALGSLLGRGIGVVLAAILFLLAIASIGLAILLYLTSAMSLVAVVLEKVDPFRALGAAFARVFGGRQFWKGFALAFALAGIYFGATAVFGGAGALLAFFLKSPALYIVCLGLMQLFFVPFAVVTAAVYYYDLRIRRDGYDLQMLIDQLASPAQAGAPQA